MPFSPAGAQLTLGAMKAPCAAPPPFSVLQLIPSLMLLLYQLSQYLFRAVQSAYGYQYLAEDGAARDAPEEGSSTSDGKRSCCGFDLLRREKDIDLAERSVRSRHISGLNWADVYTPMVLFEHVEKYVHGKKGEINQIERMVARLDDEVAGVRAAVERVEESVERSIVNLNDPGDAVVR